MGSCWLFPMPRALIDEAETVGMAENAAMRQQEILMSWPF
jgi:hypothetical protein